MEEKLIKITDKFISIPPYLSASWAAIAHIRMVGDRLIFTMKDGESISIPGFPDALIKQVFENHIRYLEGDMVRGAKKEMPVHFRFLPEGMAMPPELLKMGLQAGPEIMNMMQHNGEQKNLPDLPPDVVDKISKILKIVVLPGSDPEMLPKPEPHCNCPYCQIARALYDVKKEESPKLSEEIVSEEELTFSQFDIHASGEKLYTVTDKLFPAERFTVYLGDPVGCTCGKPGCEHIVAVLKS